MLSDLLDISDTYCWLDCCAAPVGCATGYECHHHKKDFDAARARAARKA